MRVHALLRRAAAGLAATMIAAGAGAAELALEAPIVFASGATVPERIRAECAVEGMLETAFAETRKAAARRSGSSDLPPPAAARLKLEITQVFAQGGGSWSGSKAIMLDAVLTMDGQPPLRRKFDRWATSKPILPLARSNCYILEGLAKALAKDVSRWAARTMSTTGTSGTAEPDAPASAPASGSTGP